MRFLIPSSRIKIILVALLISLAGASFVYNQILVNRIMEQERKNVELWARAFQHNFSRVQQEISQNLTMAAREIQKYEEVPDSLSRLILEAESAAITNDFVQKEIILAEDLFTIPVMRLHRLFNIPDAIEDLLEGTLLVVRSSSSRYALFVDDVIGQKQLVGKSIDMKVKTNHISGGAILEDGQVGLILDTAAIVN